MTQKHPSTYQASFRRPHFTPRQLLTSEQLNREQTFHVASLQRALFALAGPGVVYGFKIGHDRPDSSEQTQTQPGKGSLYVGCGLAFDRYGHQLDWCGGWVEVGDLVGNPPDAEGEYTLFVHYAEHRIAGSRTVDDCGGCGRDEESVLWIDASVVFTLRKGCDKKEIECYKTREGCADINGYVCERSMQEQCYKPPEDLCPTHCEGEYYDPHHGIPLACVSIVDLSRDPEHCGHRYDFCGEKVLVCDYRPFVYRNPLLYELIRGDHLNYARVEKLSWQDWIFYNTDWETPISWEDFKNRTEDADGFVITFSKPIQAKTLNPGTVILSAVARERRSHYFESRQIPLKVIPREEGDYIRTIALKLEDSWRRNEVGDEYSSIDHGVIIELTIRGALIRDECGCMLDARPLGYEQPDHPCCQTMPGGDFIALFRVAPKEEGHAYGYGERPAQAAE
jgi:hypothetical protein